MWDIILPCVYFKPVITGAQENLGIIFLPHKIWSILENEAKTFYNVSGCTHFSEKVVVEETRAAHRLCPGVSLQGRGNLGHRLIGARALEGPVMHLGIWKVIKLFSSNYIEHLLRSEMQLNVGRSETFWWMSLTVLHNIWPCWSSYGTLGYILKSISLTTHPSASPLNDNVITVCEVYWPSFMAIKGISLWNLNMHW